MIGNTKLSAETAHTLAVISVTVLGVIVGNITTLLIMSVMTGMNYQPTEIDRLTILFVSNALWIFVGTLTIYQKLLKFIDSIDD